MASTRGRATQLRAWVAPRTTLFVRTGSLYLLAETEHLLSVQLRLELLNAS